MKRSLIAIAAAVFALAANAAVADNNYVFDDPYWKQAEGSQSVHDARMVQDTQPIESQGKYDAVDKYIN